MEEDRKLYHIYRIISGYTILDINCKKYIIDTPSNKLINEGMYEFNKAIDQAKFDDQLNEEKAKFILAKDKIWTRKNEETLKTLDKSIEDHKVSLYRAYFNGVSHVAKARKYLELAKKEKIKQLLSKHCLDNVTNHGLALEVQELYVFSKIILDDNYNTLNIQDADLIKFISHEYKKILPQVSEYRLMARSEPWRTIWNTEGISCFRIVGEEQRLLISYTKMYDNIMQYSEPPPEEIIEDDDMLDGWMITIQRENEKKKDEQATNKFYGSKYGNAGEVLIPVQNKPEEIDRVLKMNDLRGQIIQKKIHQGVDDKGKMHDLQVPELALEHMNKRKK